MALSPLQVCKYISSKPPLWEQSHRSTFWCWRFNSARHYNPNLSRDWRTGALTAVPPQTSCLTHLWNILHVASVQCHLNWGVFVFFPFQEETSSAKEEKFSSIHKPVAVGSSQLLTVGTTHISKLTDEQLIKEFLSGSYCFHGVSFMYWVCSRLYLCAFCNCPWSWFWMKSSSPRKHYSVVQKYYFQCNLMLSANWLENYFLCLRAYLMRSLHAFPKKKKKKTKKTYK